MPAFDGASNVYARTVGDVALAGAALIAAFTALLLVLRLGHQLRRRRRDALTATWQAMLIRSLGSPDEPLPPLPRRFAADVLCTWIYLRECLRGEVTERLDAVARRAGFDDLARHMARSRGRWRRLVGIAALGYLRERAAWDELRLIAHSRHPVESLAAARALVHIDIEQGLAAVMPLIASRADWPPSRVAALLQDAGPDAMVEPLTRAAAEAAPASPDRAAQLVRYMVLAPSALVAPHVRALVAGTHDAGLIRACLHVLSNADDADVVRPFLAHPDWPVRSEAARTIGRLGTAADVPVLTSLLGDTAWWVRYRAAQAIASLPAIGARELRGIAAGHPNPFARDMIAHVMAERQIA
ncbi:MAG TPA: HEAT repeat domain-containing protein [Gemmatimonadales bacterium]